MKMGKWVKIIIPIFAVVIIGGFILWQVLMSGSSLMSGTGIIAEAKYPEVKTKPEITEYENSDGILVGDEYGKAYEAWVTEQFNRLEKEVNAENLYNFFESSAETFLSESGGENVTYSPLNVYMALGLLAEVTDGESRKQILDLLETEDVSGLRKQANEIWNKQYRNDGIVSRITANSVWLNDEIKYNKETLDLLSNNYYASSYSGKMGSDKFNKVIRDWVNSQTKDFLTEQSADIEFAEDTILALASTIYFQGKWSAEFSKEATKSGIFHGESGDVDVKFMNYSDGDMYYWDDKFAAVERYFEEWGGSMWFILPDEGISVDEILSEKKYMELTCNANDWKNQKVLTVNQQIPKFDASSQLDLKDGLIKLGIKDVFDDTVSDFTPLTEDSVVELNKIEHAARVSIDEEGVIAAAYTVEIMEGEAMPPEEEVDFILDRPFIFVINGEDNIPLFAGVVKNPSGMSADPVIVSQRFLKDRDYQEEYTNWDEPVVEVFNGIEEACEDSPYGGPFEYTEEYSKTGVIYKVTYNTANDGLLGPVVVYLDENYVVFGEQYRE